MNSTTVHSWFPDFKNSNVLPRVNRIRQQGPVYYCCHLSLQGSWAEVKSTFSSLLCCAHSTHTTSVCSLLLAHTLCAIDSIYAIHPVTQNYQIWDLFILGIAQMNIEADWTNFSSHILNKKEVFREDRKCYIFGNNVLISIGDVWKMANVWRNTKDNHFSQSFNPPPSLLVQFELWQSRLNWYRRLIWGYEN